MDLSIEVYKKLPIDLFDEDIVAKAKRMAVAYVAIASFENTVREFVSKVLLENVGADWWQTHVYESIRKKAENRREEENKIKWHTHRGDMPINYTEFGDLGSIVRQNWQYFTDYLYSQEWMQQIFLTLERSRNVIMHSGELGTQDIERIGTAINDWIKQVGV
ncbi:MAG: Swt1 family HEPN domain-containing protein [Terracidiphilus sp.]|nr:Swt1 family HEPN domain-containing protein [Terracidiphilus sp.]